MLQARISIDPQVLAGKPVIRGTRIPVHLILELLEAGKSIEEIASDYPDLRKEDVKAAIHYAESLLKREEVVLTS